MPDDADLIRRAVLRDRSAAGEIYDRFAPLVRAIAREATSHPHEVDELVQEIFLRVLSRLSQVRQPEALAGWVVQVSRSQVADFERLRGKRRLRESPLSEDPVESQPVELADTRAQVRSAIAQLDDNERLAVHLYYLCDQPAEVARQALGLSPSGFYKLIERARARLRRLLSVSVGSNSHE